MNEHQQDLRYSHAFAIYEGRANGHALPILRSLARRGHALSMTMLADEVERPGSIACVGSAQWFYYRAYRRGHSRAAHNLAMTRLNSGDFLGYRHWLRKAAKAGDLEAGKELRRFATRFPHDAMRKWRRLCPWRKCKG